MSERTDLVIATLSGVDLLLCSELEDDLAGQGAVLAQALTLWLMRHPKAKRAALLDLHLVGVREAWARREREEG
jgi:hypothetical protein